MAADKGDFSAETAAVFNLLSDDGGEEGTVEIDSDDFGEGQRQTVGYPR